MDALTITAIIASVSGLLVAICTHVKHSKCFGIDVETRDPVPVVIQAQPSPRHSPTTTRKLDETNV